MSAEKSLALVLRVVQFSETSAVVTLFTRDFGKIGALAKGARRPKGPFESALDLLGLVRVVFLRKSSDALDLLTEAKLERRFRPRGRDLTTLYAGYYVAELLTRLTHEYDPHPELFDVAEQTLCRLSTEGSVASLVLRFEMSALRLLGHLPVLDRCAECGTAVARTGQVRFGQLAGGILCPRCRVGQKRVAVVRAEVIEALDQFARQGDAWEHYELDRRTRGELRGLINHYLANLLGGEPRLHRFLGTLAG